MLVSVITACAEAPAFDSAAYLQSGYERELGVGGPFEVPFALSPESLAEIESQLSSRGSARRRAGRVVEWIFGSLGLEYALYPTLDAEETLRARKGNCLSFVNLFIGVARHIGLNAFYVEVVDQRGWSYRQGTVVSRGHIVAGVHLDGVLETFDFLPYRPKSYRDLQPLEDRLAVAHHYNNLGAEALISGDLETAEKHLSLVQRIAPDFVNGLNNLGVCLVRLGKTEAALAIYREGLELEPENIAVLTNAARLFQEQGLHEKAQVLLTRIESTRHASPYFYVYQGERAIAQGELDQALGFLREALRRDSELPEVHLGLVRLYLALGDLDEARHFLIRARQLDASHPELAKVGALLAANAQ
ncbi:MAG: tetratricopeptide repeat protein [Acidobacteriota bacterium]